MATIRTFKQTGCGYLSESVSIIAKIDGTVIYSGPVPVRTEPLPPLPDVSFSITSVLYTWEEDISFSGQHQLEIAVSGGTLLLTDTVANYVNSSDSNIFGNFYSYQDGTMTIYDPLANEAIDGVLQPEDHVGRGLLGQWWWLIPDGTVFTSLLNVNAGVEPSPPPGPV